MFYYQKICISSIVCFLLQGPYSPWEEGKVFMFILHEYVIYSKIFRKLHGNWQGWVSRGFCPNLMLHKNNVCYILHWYYMIFCGFLERGIFPSRDFNPQIYHQSHLRTFCLMFLRLPSSALSSTLCIPFGGSHSFHWKPLFY